MAKLRYLTKEGFRNLGTNRLMTLASITVLFSCLLLVGIAFMLLVNIQSFIENIESENVIMVYADVELETDSLEFTSLYSRLKNNTNYVENAEIVDKDTAYKEILAGLDENLSTYLSSSEENPLPNGIKVTVSDMEHFDDVVKNIKAMDNVYRIHENSTLAGQLASIKNAVQYISIGVIALLLIVSLFIISNTIKVTMFSRRLEISIMKSVGATNSFIKWPFMVEGIIIGVISGILSTGAVWGLYELVMGELLSVFSAFSDMKKISFISYAPYLAAIFICVGVFTGIFGSATSIRKYLKERKFVELDD